MKRFFAGTGKGLLAFLLFLGVQMLVSVVAVIVIMILLAFSDPAIFTQGSADAVSSELLKHVYGEMLPILLLSSLVTLATLSIICLAHRKNPLKEVGLRPVPARTILPTILIAVSANVFVGAFIALLPPELLSSSEAEKVIEQAMLADPARAFLFTVLAVVLAGPLTEEVVFRGLILSRFRRVMPAALAVLLSAFLFGFAHFNLLQSGYTFVLGVLFAILALRCRSILPTVVCHVVFNALGLFSGVFMLLPPAANAVIAICAAAATGIGMIFLFRATETLAGDFVPEEPSVLPPKAFPPPAPALVPLDLPSEI